MDLINALPKTDLDIVDYLIDRGAGDIYRPKEGVEKAPVEKILAPWAQAKDSYLYPLLGEQLITSKLVEFNRPHEDLVDEIYEWQDSNHYENSYQAFRHEYEDCLHQHYHNNEVEWTLRTLVYADALATNIINEPHECEINLPNLPHPYKVKQGTKVMRILQKIANAYNLTSFEAFRLDHSRIFNQKTYTGELCLSIHPLDYITMSDNNCGWSSCMSWKECGEYRQGTVEMMNSPYVLVAYLNSSHPMRIGNISWTNKKWRELFVITPDLIAGIKGYPYQSKDLETIIIDWIRELAATNLNTQYSKQTYTYEGRHTNQYLIDGTKIKAKFYTQMMYNDFGTRDKDDPHLIKLNANINTEEYKFIQVPYSGMSECMWCGETYYRYSDYLSEESLICSICCGNIYTCTYCGDSVSEEEVYLIDDEYYCPHCYHTQVRRDFITDNIHSRSNMTWIEVINDEGQVEDNLYTDIVITDKIYRIGVNDALMVSDQQSIGFTSIVNRLWDCFEHGAFDLNIPCETDPYFAQVNIKHLTDIALEYMNNPYPEYS